MKVSTVFPESRRNYGLAWGVYKQLTRVEGEDWQDRYLADNPHATTSRTERAVNTKVTADRKAVSGVANRRRFSDHAWVPGVDVDITVEDQANGRVTLTGDIDKAAIVYSEIHGKWAWSSR